MCSSNILERCFCQKEIRLIKKIHESFVRYWYEGVKRCLGSRGGVGVGLYIKSKHAPSTNPSAAEVTFVQCTQKQKL